MSSDAHLPRVLGWASLALGIPMIVAPRALLRTIGVRPTDTARAWTAVVGARELAAAAGLLVLGRGRPLPWVLARAAGDAKDLALLASATHDDSARVRLAAGAVAGIAATDALAALRLSRAPHATAEEEDVEVRAAMTTVRPRADVEAAWQRSEEVAQIQELGDVDVRFADAPGDRGTEVHITLRTSVPLGPVGAALKKVVGTDPRQQAFDHLRRFKQVLETGEVTRSDGTPAGHSAKTQPKQRPAQPVEA